MALFGALVVGAYPVPQASFTQQDATHWTLDTRLLTPDYAALKEVALFLTQPGGLDNTAGLSLYVSVAGSDWQYRGSVHGARPSDVFPLDWPSAEAPAASLGVVLEPLAGVLAKEEAWRYGAKEAFAKRVAMDLFRYLESFADSSQLVVPAKFLDAWFTKFQAKFRRDPHFLTRAARPD